MARTTPLLLLKSYLRNPLCNLNRLEKAALLVLIEGSKELSAYQEVNKN